MGVTLSVACPGCGYSERVYEGDGILARLEPRLCSDCCRVVSVTVAVTLAGIQSGAVVDAEHCPLCGAAALQPWATQIHRDSLFAAPCPACGEEAYVRAAARWD